MYSQTPTRSVPRLSGLPTPGRTSIPTPGRPRSATGGHGPEGFTRPNLDSEDMTKALSEAIRANDPSSHRISDASSIGAPEATPIMPGRRSAAGGLRPSLVTASRSSSTHSAPSGYADPTPKTPITSFRSKTPVTSTPGASSRMPFTPRQSFASNRPDSRASESRSSSRLGGIVRPFEVGDRVRIESLGMEGTLRFLGEASFKPGIWAGVELSGGFAGRGKNDGSVNGVQYFTCPPNCGVFVASSKLSAPTVGQGARPPSVASSRGRVTPSPLFPPSSYVTPGRPSKTATVNRAPTTPSQPMITPGSRASKYVGMTAKQLTSRDAEKGGSISSTSSPVRLGTMATPKPRTSTTGGAALPTPKSSRLSFATPGHTPKQSRYVVPSSSRPPVPDLPQGLSISPLPGLPNDGFAKPHTPTFSQTSSETFVDEMSEDSRALELNGRALQDKIASLMSGPSKARHLSPDEQSSDRESERSRSMSWLQGRIDSLEGENRKLRADIVILAEKASVSSNPEDAQLLSAARGKNEVLEEEKKRLAARIVELEAQTKIDARALKERQDKIESVERSAQSATDHADKIRLEGESKVRDALSKLADSEALVNSLKEAIQMNTSAASENHAVLQAKDAEITLLETRVARATADLEEERRELGGQVDELRRAGQETIALYEERLNASDTRRYEMEDLIQALEEQLRKQAEPVSPTALTQQANTAAQIDNETLREQATHLQKKILMLEEQLDDARASQERDDAAAQARITRYRENDAALRKDIAELKAEMDKNARAEMAARTRAEEIAEALRENGVALEDARAEIETLRSELANLESVQDGAPLAESNSSNDLKKSTRGPNEEVSTLRELLEDSRLGKRKLQEQLDAVASKADAATKASEALRADLQALENEKVDFERLNQDLQLDLASERKLVIELRRSLDERSLDLNLPELRKRDSQVSVSSRVSRLSNGRDESSNLRDQITGLKHVVQELTKENAALVSQNKMLDSDNKLLQSETEELREAMKSLEAALEENILREERALNGDPSSPGHAADADTSGKSIHTKCELEIDQLRRKMSEMEKKNTRTVHELNKEIAELENLVEAKIYHQDDLEREVDRLKDKLRKTTSKTSGESMLAPKPPRSAPRVHQSNGSATSATTEIDDPDNICEICGDAGHDILTCALVFKEPSGSSNHHAGRNGDPEDVWCDDCESRSHSTADCPHSQDVF